MLMLSGWATLALIQRSAQTDLGQNIAGVSFTSGSLGQFSEAFTFLLTPPLLQPTLLLSEI
jgi:hypothetical protein